MFNFVCCDHLSEDLLYGIELLFKPVKRYNTTYAKAVPFKNKSFFKHISFLTKCRFLTN